jgi:hypothetical protein
VHLRFANVGSMGYNDDDDDDDDDDDEIKHN